MSSFGRALSWLGTVAVFAWVAGAASAQAIAGSCTVQFFGTSTLHDWEGTAPCALLAVEAPDASGRYGARAEVAIAQMDTDNSSRDKRMREMFEAKKFPRIVATFASVDPAELRAQRAGALPFQIAMHGVERNVAPTISDFSEVPGKSAHFRASFELTLGEFGLEAPVVMGFIRVDERVKVVVDVDLSAKGGAPVASPQTR
jgi:YceI-like domain